MRTAGQLRRRADDGDLAIEGGLLDGHLVRVKRNVYVDAPASPGTWLARASQHDALVEAVRRDGDDGVVALESAVMLHGGRVWETTSSLHLVVGYHSEGLRAVHFSEHIRDLGPAARRRALRSRPVIRHCWPVDDDDVVIIDGLRVTSLARTMEDCARFLPADAAMVAVDSLLAIGSGACAPGERDGAGRPWDRAEEINTAANVLRAEVAQRLKDRPRQRGVRRARAVIAAGSPWSQSAYETELRRLCLVNGVVPPMPQMPVRTPWATYFIDLGWWGLRKGAEVDGDVKLEGDPEAELERRAARDLDVHDMGIDLAHFTTEDVRDPARVMEKLGVLLPPSAFTAVPAESLRTPWERRSVEW
ncbi:hypothetical protein [Actinomyces sp. ZJ751]|nr:hypothetical protein [Actinomyces sp. ZJ751]